MPIATASSMCSTAPTAKLLAANPYVKVNWASGIDMKTGRPIETDVTKDAREGKKVVGLSVDPRRQELGADVVQSADRPRLCQHACLRRPLQDRAGDLQGRRMVSRHGSDRSVGVAGRRTARPPQGDRSDDRQDQVGSAERHPALLRRAVDRRRRRVLRPVDRRVRGVRRRQRQEAVAASRPAPASRDSR